MRNGSMFPLSSEFSLYNIWTNNFWTVQIQISLATRVFGLRGSEETRPAPATQANAVFIRLSALGLLKVLDLDSGSRESGGHL